jgi:hypothetical protein
MPFKETKALINNESKVKIDVETLARIEFSDVEYLLRRIKEQTNDERLIRILYESLVSKTASIYQLAMRAYDYLEKKEKLKELNKNYRKDGNTSLGRMAKYRSDLFHDGIHFLERKNFYPFGIIEGRGFAGIRVKKGATFKILGIWEFHSLVNEYAITSEGVFEIYNPGTIDEDWILIENYPTVTAINYDQVRIDIENAIKQLKQVWDDIPKLVKNGDGTHSCNFVCENGNLELLELQDEEIKSYKLGSIPLIITGHYTINPPEKLIIKDNSIQYK